MCNKAVLLDLHWKIQSDMALLNITHIETTSDIKKYNIYKCKSTSSKQEFKSHPSPITDTDKINDLINWVIVLINIIVNYL